MEKNILFAVIILYLSSLVSYKDKALQDENTLLLKKIKEEKELSQKLQQEQNHDIISSSAPQLLSSGKFSFYMRALTDGNQLLS